jgi:hypothetical protein
LAGCSAISVDAVNLFHTIGWSVLSGDVDTIGRTVTVLSIYQEENVFFIGFKRKGNKMTGVYFSFTGLAETYTERLLSATKQKGFIHFHLFRPR